MRDESVWHCHSGSRCRALGIGTEMTTAGRDEVSHVDPNHREDMRVVCTCTAAGTATHAVFRQVMLQIETLKTLITFIFIPVSSSLPPDPDSGIPVWGSIPN
jgi:hypothetical protein